MQPGFLPEILTATAQLRGEATVSSMQAVIDQSVFLRTPLEKPQNSELADIVESISCLEHTRHFADAPAALNLLTYDSTRHLHMINFGNHRNRAKSFDDRYEMAPNACVRPCGCKINLLRLPHIQTPSTQTGAYLGLELVAAWLHPIPQAPNPFWSDRSDLAIWRTLVVDRAGTANC
ncbi:MAG: hypothetical protein OXC54_07170 [Rhodospirillaceae bacterium]|nr:hypothetical protein [Rhodospirillaceae bacterium]